MFEKYLYSEKNIMETVFYASVFVCFKTWNLHNYKISKHVDHFEKKSGCICLENTINLVFLLRLLCNILQLHRWCIKDISGKLYKEKWSIGNFQGVYNNQRNLHQFSFYIKLHKCCRLSRVFLRIIILEIQNGVNKNGYLYSGKQRVDWFSDFSSVNVIVFRSNLSLYVWNFKNEDWSYAIFAKRNYCYITILC